MKCIILRGNTVLHAIFFSSIVIEILYVNRMIDQ